jgi:hypothetical protein
LINYELYKKGSKKPDAFIGIQVKLFDIQESKIVGKNPLLYVLFSGCECGEWDANEFMISKVFNEDCIYELEDDCVWQCYDEDEELGSERDFEETLFAYVIPLVEINNNDDITELIIEPIKMAILGKKIGPYLKKNNKVIKFVSVDNEVTLKSTKK